MFLVVFIPGALVLQRVRLRDARPDAASPIDPCLIVNLAVINWRHRHSILTVLAEQQDAIQDGRAAGCAVLALLCEQQRLCLRADGLRLWILGNDCPPVINPAFSFVCFDNLAGKVFHADIAVLDCHRRDVCNVYAG